MLEVRRRHQNTVRGAPLLPISSPLVLLILVLLSLSSKPPLTSSPSISDSACNPYTIWGAAAEHIADTRKSDESIEGAAGAPESPDGEATKDKQGVVEQEYAIDEQGSGEWEGSSVRVLTDATFEHETQAATGQTTGRWLVLFSRGAEQERVSEGSTMVERALDQLSEEPSFRFITAKVDVGANPGLAARFSITATPILKLFRERQMYSFPPRAVPWDVSTVREFCESGFRNVESEEVPGEPNLWEKLWGQLTQFLQRLHLAELWDQRNILIRHPLVVLTLGILVSLAAYRFTLRILAFRDRRKQRATAGKRKVGSAKPPKPRRPKQQ
eukprot:TRINITY_DN36019_c0_g1_i1.p1 TRINITY_DN36019_c0_g1~~TRINITY_DN36019_c0_g1_i1.p1  ORF type:complete len:328 (+),score=43.11 TRINITY_DN36019_c0_g1_i1:353-1336(+)